MPLIENRLKLPFLLVAMLLWSCGDVGPDNPSFTIPFVANVNGVALECGQVYEGLGASASSIDVRDVRFYIHDVQLLTEEGTAVELLLDNDNDFQLQYSRADGSTGAVALLDFTDTSSETCAIRGTSATRGFIVGTAPEGAYSGVRFKVGVPQEINHVDGAVSEAPLNAYGMQWTWASGYRHMKIDVKATTGDKVKEAYYFHPGSQGCESSSGDIAGPYACSMPLLSTIELDMNIDNQAVEFDLARFYASDDLNRGNGCMFVRNLSDFQDGEDVEPNGCSEMFGAIGLTLPETEGGAAGTTTQSAFRVVDFSGTPGEAPPYPDVSTLDVNNPSGWPHPDYERPTDLDVAAVSVSGGTSSHPPGDPRYGANCMQCHQSNGPGEGQYVAAGTIYNSAGEPWVEGGTIELGTAEQAIRFGPPIPLEEKLVGWELKLALPIDAHGQWYATAVPDINYQVENYYARVLDAEGELKMVMAIAPGGGCNHCHSTGFEVLMPSGEEPAW
tara:strand:+ start:4491 stop:5993 length:1503 start_codon:yes stop_codon:yes gene_type:complete